MESKYKELIEELRTLARGTLNDRYKVPLDAAAYAVETLSRSIAAYAKANEELLAWRRNAEEWMNRVAEEKAAAYHRDSAAMRADEPVNAVEKTPTMSVLYLCDRRKCDRCNPECKRTEDVRHAKHFEVGEYGGYIQEVE